MFSNIMVCPQNMISLEGTGLLRFWITEVPFTVKAATAIPDNLELCCTAHQHLVEWATFFEMRVHYVIIHLCVCVCHCVYSQHT